MKFLLIGGTATLGKALGVHLSTLGHEVISTSRQNDGNIFFDLEKPESEWPQWPDNIDGAFIAGAMTKQDECANNLEKAHFINVEQTIRLAENLIANDIHVVYPSTNIVLACDTPNQPVDSPLAPLGVYAETKAAVEKVLFSNPHVTIARLPKILSGDTGILKSWSDKLDRNEKIEAFDDLIVSPVSLMAAEDFLTLLMELQPQGLWQFSGAQEISYYELARLLAAQKGKPADLVIPAKMPPHMAAASPLHPSLDMSQTTERLAIPAQTPSEMLLDCFKTA